MASKEEEDVLVTAEVIHRFDVEADWISYGQHGQVFWLSQLHKYHPHVKGTIGIGSIWEDSRYRTTGWRVIVMTDARVLNMLTNHASHRYFSWEKGNTLEGAIEDVTGYFPPGFFSTRPELLEHFKTTYIEAKKRREHIDRLVTESQTAHNGESRIEEVD